MINFFNILASSQSTVLPLFSDYLTLNNEGHPTHVISSFQHKHSYYYNGKTYFLWMKTNALNNKNMVFSFDHSTKEVSQSYDTLSTKAGSNDLHSHGSIFVTSSGSILVATCTRILPGGDGGIIISRASTSDISSWTPQTEIGTDLQYCQITQITSGRIFIWYRDARDAASIIYSDDDGLTWSNPLKFFDFNNDPNEGMYPYGIHNNGGSKIYLIINRRNWVSGVKFPERYYLESTDGVIFSNKAGTWSKNVQANGVITKAEIEANSMIEQAASQDSVIYNSGGVIGNDGEIYLISVKESDSGLNFTYWNGSAWVIKEITPRQGTHTLSTSRQSIYHIGGNSFRVYCLDTIGGKDQLVSYLTTDKGDTWTYERTLTDTQFTHYLRANLTDNFQVSNKGLIATMKGDGTGQFSEIYIEEIEK